MTSVLFVHGIGTRRPQFDAVFEVIKRNLLSRRPDLTVTPCYWGEPLGADLYANGASIPDYPTTRGPEEMKEEDYQIALWEQLYRDPLFELRLLSIKAVDTTAFQARGGPPQPDLLGTFTPSTALQAELEEAGIAEVFEPARQSVQGSAAYKRALLAPPQAPESYRAVTARAVVAKAIEVCEEKQIYAPLVIDASLRDQLIEQVGNELAGTRRAFGSWAAKQLFELALTLGVMDQVQRKRGALTDATYPCAGDILLYQGRGEKIRAFIAGLVQQAEPPVVLFGHSLGGVVCVDLLVQQTLPQVQLLVTVGSQAPYFYEINALHSLAWNEPLPVYFPTWLNIYDLRDFLSYVGASVFPGKLRDMRVDSRQPFPHSHGAYFTNPETWEVMVPLIPF